MDGIKDLPPSKAYLGVEIDNIIQASDEVLAQCKSNQVPELTPAIIKHFNSRVLHGLTLDPEIRPGEVRNYSVGVADYRKSGRRKIAMNCYLAFVHLAWRAVDHQS